MRIRKLLTAFCFLIALFSFLAILPSSTYAAKCEYALVPNPPVSNMDNLKVWVKSPDLAGGAYQTTLKGPTQSSSSYVLDIGLNPNGTYITFNKPTAGWQPGSYTFYLMDRKKGSGTATVQSKSDCSTTFVINSVSEQKLCTTKIISTNITPDTNVEMEISQIISGTYDIYINGQNRGSRDLRDGKIELGNFSAGQYRVEIRNRCGMLGASCYIGNIPPLQCSISNFAVSSRDGSSGSSATGASAFNPLGNCPNGKRGIDTAIGCVPIGDSGETIAWFLSWFIGISGGVAFLLIVISGFQIMTASGDPQKLQGGREMLTAAVSGLILIIFSVYLLNLIGVEILKLPGF